MKTKINLILPLICITAVFTWVSCEEKEDYSHIVFKNYLTYEINRAVIFLNNVTEGETEGEYRPGSKQAYQEVIDDAREVNDDAAASQEEVDQAYQVLLQADIDFFDQMVPFRSLFQDIINYANFILANTQEGDLVGNVKAGEKAILQESINQASQLLSAVDLTQRMLDQGTVELNNAIYFFNGEIIGKAFIELVNHGFEIPGYATEDFGEVEGWSLFGRIEEWAPRASVTDLESAPEGSFAAKIGSYTQGLYQPVEEMINPNAEYTLEFDVSLISNDPDWQGSKYPAVLRSRIIIFEELRGDYDFITVLSESFDTLGIDPGGFITLNQSVTIDAISASIGKKLVIDFEQRHTWNAENPIWAESFAAIDKVNLTRKL